MNHEDAFWQAIRAAPDDDDLRLIFADWLEDRGDPRGPFLRAQVQLAAWPPEAPSRLDLEEQARDLLHEHAEEWTAPVRGKVLDWQFRRGLLEHVRLSSDALLTHAE